jgi:hypothetical protein
MPKIIPDTVLPQAQTVGGTPLEKLIMNFMEMPQVQGCKYLLVFVYIFSGWVEAFPTWTEKAQDVSRCLLKETIPQFRIPVSIGSDNGPAFVAELVQLMAKGLGITWKLHIAYRPQNLGKVEHKNRTLKLQLRKLSGDPSAVGSIMPIALLRIRYSPMKQTGLSPFEVLYGCPSPLIKGIRGDLKEIGDLTLRQQMQGLGLTFSKINDWVQERLPVSLTNSHAPLLTRGCLLGKEMECPTNKASLERPFCCYFVYHYCSQSSRDSYLVHYI